jgi:hypothetical protein
MRGFRLFPRKPPHRKSRILKTSGYFTTGHYSTMMETASRVAAGSQISSHRIFQLSQKHLLEIIGELLDSSVTLLRAVEMRLKLFTNSNDIAFFRRSGPVLCKSCSLLQLSLVNFSLTNFSIVTKEVANGNEQNT